MLHANSGSLPFLSFGDMGARKPPSARNRVAILIAAFSTLPVPIDVREQVQTDPATAAKRLESIVAIHPNDYDARLLLGEAHYKLARAALNLPGEPTYLKHARAEPRAA